MRDERVDVLKAQRGGGRDGGRCSIWWGGGGDDEDVPFSGGRDEEDVPFGGGEGCGRCSICHIPIEPNSHF